MNDSLRVKARTARAEIESGTLRGAALLELLLSIPVSDRDVFVDEAIGLEDPPPDVPDLPRGAVPYLPCGVEEILAMVREVPVSPEDVLVDLGSGVGRVVILAHLLTGVTGQGIELQALLVRIAVDRVAALGLKGVSFERADVAATVLDGSIFFLYAPFNGELLTAVLRRLEAVAVRRPIVVCTVGLELGQVTWLRARKTASVELTIYDSSVH